MKLLTLKKLNQLLSTVYYCTERSCSVTSLNSPTTSFTLPFPPPLWQPHCTVSTHCNNVLYTGAVGPTWLQSCCTHSCSTNRILCTVMYCRQRLGVMCLPGCSHAVPSTCAYLDTDMLYTQLFHQYCNIVMYRRLGLMGIHQTSPIPKE